MPVPLQPASLHHFGVIRDGASVVIKHTSECLAAGEQRTRSTDGFFLSREALSSNVRVIFRIKLGSEMVHGNAPYLGGAIIDRCRAARSGQRRVIVRPIKGRGLSPMTVATVAKNPAKSLILFAGAP
jgi:hypothetical protein